MNIDEGKSMLDWVVKLYPVKKWDTILYIGACEKTFKEWEGDYFLHYIRSKKKIFTCTVIEKYLPYVEIIKSLPVYSEFKLKLICDDIINYARHTKNIYNIIIWWHGPEHIHQEEFETIVPHLEKICSGVIILGCPEGKDDFSDVISGDHHKWDVSYKYLQSLGFKTKLINRELKGQGNSINALKLVKK